MSRNSPQPKVQTRAKRARIHSQKPLNPESDLIAPSPLNKPLEASSAPTTSGFTSHIFTISHFITHFFCGHNVRE